MCLRTMFRMVAVLLEIESQCANVIVLIFFLSKSTNYVLTNAMEGAFYCTIVLGKDDVNQHKNSITADDNVSIKRR